MFPTTVWVLLAVFGHNRCHSYTLKQIARSPMPSSLPTLFLPRDAMRKRGLCCRPVSVCLSVTLVHRIQTAEDIVKLLCRPGSPIILVV